MIGHDHNFKNMALDYTARMIELGAPPEAAALPSGVKFEPVRQELLKENLDDSFHELDVPIKATFPDGTTEALFFVFENESTDRANFLHYLAIVCLELSMMLKTRRVVPVAVHLFRTKPLDCNLKLASDKATYLDFSCHSLVLGTMNALDYQHSSNIVARLCMPLMRYEQKDRLLVITRSFEGLAALEIDAEKRRKYAGFITYYAKMEKQEKSEFFGKYVISSPYKEDIMTLAQILEEEGIAKGKEMGKAEGKAEGRVANILELFQEGAITDATARTWLLRYADNNVVPKDLVDEALLKLSSK